MLLNIRPLLHVCHPMTQLENFTAGQLASLLKCDLPGNHSHSRRVWKLLLTQHLPVLDPALDRLANTVSMADGVAILCCLFMNTAVGSKCRLYLYYIMHM